MPEIGIHFWYISSSPQEKQGNSNNKPGQRSATMYTWEMTHSARGSKASLVLKHIKPLQANLEHHRNAAAEGWPNPFAAYERNIKCWANEIHKVNQEEKEESSCCSSSDESLASTTKSFPTREGFLTSERKTGLLVCVPELDKQLQKVQKAKVLMRNTAEKLLNTQTGETQQVNVKVRWRSLKWGQVLTLMEWEGPAGCWRTEHTSSLTEGQKGPSEITVQHGMGSTAPRADTGSEPRWNSVALLLCYIFTKGLNCSTATDAVTDISGLLGWSHFFMEKWEITKSRILKE